MTEEFKKELLNIARRINAPIDNAEKEEAKKEAKKEVKKEEKKEQESDFIKNHFFICY